MPFSFFHLYVWNKESGWEKPGEGVLFRIIRISLRFHSGPPLWERPKRDRTVEVTDDGRQTNNLKLHLCIHCVGQSLLAKPNALCFYWLQINTGSHCVVGSGQSGPPLSQSFLCGFTGTVVGLVMSQFIPPLTHRRSSPDCLLDWMFWDSFSSAHRAKPFQTEPQCSLSLSLPE